ncbi:MAG: hypothetical protein IJ574_01000 [Bacilli bacterium]|nr:hypothetical protein [Bacilli bacterium]
MTTKQYAVLNMFLCDLFKVDNFYLKNLESVSLLKSLYQENIANYTLTDNDKSIDLSIDETNELAREILGTINDKYVVAFDKFLREKRIKYSDYYKIGSFYDLNKNKIFI